MEMIDYVKSLPVKQFGKNELVLASGDRSDTLFAIREGAIKMVSTDDEGREKILWLAGRLDVIPLEHFFSTRPLNYDYIGFSDGSAYIIEKKIIKQVFEKNPAFVMEVAQGLSEHLDDVLERLSAFGQVDIRSRILHTMYNIAGKFGSSDVVKLHELGLNLTHQDVADIVGARREFVSIELNKIRKQGFIEYDRTSFTVNVEKIRDELNLLS